MSFGEPLRLFRALTAAAVLCAAALALVGCRKADVSVSPEEITVGNGAEAVTFHIESDASWTISSANTWVTVEPASGSGSTDISLTALPNSSGTTRETEIYITAGKAEGTSTAILTVIQKALVLSFSPDRVEVPKDGGTVQFKVNSDGPWNILKSDTCIRSVNPVSGVGDAVVEITCGGNPLRRSRNLELLFRSGSMVAHLPVVVEPQENNPPEVPSLEVPSSGQSDVSVLPRFSWKCSDPDGDVLSYTVSLSDDGTAWRQYSTDVTFFQLEEPLEQMTDYLWKVTADDGNGRENSVSVSAVAGFTTSAKTYYDDGEALLIHQADASIAHPVNLIFMGDGYIKEDYALGGTFISEMNEGVEALFSVEPYKSYEDYFNIYAVATYSNERGMTTGVQDRDTRFKVTRISDDRTGLECDVDSVFRMACLVPGIDEQELRKAPVFLMSNQNVYAGTCIMYSTGESISIIPVSRLKDPSVSTDYAGILLHEGGGHGFGRLADEYINFSGETIPESGDGWSVASVKAWQSVNSFLNISISKDDPDLIPWSGLMGLEGYSAITNPQGGLYYEFGVWRSEQYSCMIDNRSYYSAAQRMAIVKRIKLIAGETFILEDFIEKDTVRSPSDTKSAYGPVPDGFEPLAPPVMAGSR